MAARKQSSNSGVANFNYTPKNKIAQDDEIKRLAEANGFYIEDPKITIAREKREKKEADEKRIAHEKWLEENKESEEKRKKDIEEEGKKEKEAIEKKKKELDNLTPEQKNRLQMIEE